jgi:FAD/FMN-containing dehydrogenase
LFWALRGGGGNFGVVVDFTFRLHQVGQLLGGLLTYNLANAEPVVAAWRELMATAPDELVCFAGLARSLFTAQERVAISVAYFGDLEEGGEVIRPLTEAAAPVHDGVRPMYYAELQDIFGRMPFGLRHYWSGRFLHELTDDVIELTVNQFQSKDVHGTILLEPMHGAATRVAVDATAFAGRDARYNATFVGAWEDPREDQRRIDVARGYSAALAPWAPGGGYLNYASEMAAGGVETEFGAARFERLRAVKRTFDPENTFRFNHNIAPD